jgi:hypothetical protein
MTISALAFANAFSLENAARVKSSEYSSARTKQPKPEVRNISI